MKLIKNKVNCEKSVRYNGKIYQKVTYYGQYLSAPNSYKKGPRTKREPEIAEGRFELSTLRV